MRILVTGASGFIGAAVVRRAIEAGHEVTAAVRPGSDLWRLPPVFTPHALASFDLGATSYGWEQSQMSHALRRCDAVIHCAWENSRAARANASAQLRSFSGTWALFEAAMRVGVKRFVAVGSQAEGGLTPYGRAKRAIRDLLSLYDESQALVWARLYSVYGPGERRGDSLIVRLVRHGLACEREAQRVDDAEGPVFAPIHSFRPESTCEHRWHYLYEDDAADQLLALAESTRTGVVELPGHPPAKLRDALNFVWNRHFKSAPPIAFGSRMDPDLPYSEPFMLPSVTFAEGVKRLVETMRKELIK